MEEQQQIIWYLTRGSNVWKEGIVVGCDPDIGITIIDKANPGIYVCCLL